MRTPTMRAPAMAHYLRRAAPSMLRSAAGRDPLQTLPYGEAIVHTACVSACTRPATCWARPRCGWSTGAGCGSPPATTSSQPDGTCAPFEPVRCDTFITESTFGLPIYRWPQQAEMFADINAWWRGNAAQGRASILLLLRFGKAQRILPASIRRSARSSATARSSR